MKHNRAIILISLLFTLLTSQSQYQFISAQPEPEPEITTHPTPTAPVRTAAPTLQVGA